MSLTVPAFAKINLRLHVLGKRADGYHEIETLLQTISLHDTLNFTLLDDPHIVLSCNDRNLASPDNLVHRAAVALQSHAPNKGAHITVHKRIPTQAGLGGGSSDAAVALAALCHLWEIDLAAHEVRALAISLGADVPFFFFGGSAQATGTGTELKPLNDLPPMYLVVVKPNASISTAEAYVSLNLDSLTSSNSKTILSSSQLNAISATLNPDALKNDFEAVAFQLAPEIGRARAALLQAGAGHAQLTGSGSAVFGVFDNRAAQERAIQAIELETGWRAFPCTTVGRSHYRSAVGPVGSLFARFSG
jgi:4-diphosphocytidyl-2-C-methyl-D-erythritol kinase